MTFGKGLFIGLMVSSSHVFLRHLLPGHIVVSKLRNPEVW
jgi:hypothetical protein